MSDVAKIIPPESPINSSVTVPGSKSYANRALIIASLTKNSVTLHNLTSFDDTIAMINSLKDLGIVINQKDGDTVVVNSIFELDPINVTLNAKQSATAFRFLIALCCLIPGTQIITGHESLLKRPVEPLIDSLKQLGASIARNDSNEVIISSSQLKSSEVDLDASGTSQFLTALLLIAPLIGLSISAPLIATESYIEITKDIMQTFGVEIASNNGQFSVQKQEYEIIEYTIEPDISSASYFWALAALSGGAIVVEKVDTNSKQGDLQILQILEKMGAHVVTSNEGIKVIGNTLNPVQVDMSNCPDQVQTVAVVAAFASGTTTIHGVQTLRLKETDRLSAIISELKKMNIVAETDGQTLVIHGGDPKGAVIETYLDHRMAMSFAIAGSRIANMKINDSEVVSKTFPDFWDKLQSIGVEIS